MSDAFPECLNSSPEHEPIAKPIVEEIARDNVQASKKRARKTKKSNPKTPLLLEDADTRLCRKHLILLITRKMSFHALKKIEISVCSLTPKVEPRSQETGRKRHQESRR